MRSDLEILQGACDIHVHTNPDVFRRMVDDVEAARGAKAYGFRAIITKSHQLETASRAHFARRLVDGIDIFGSTTLDYSHGGLNPFCVDAVIKIGAKKVYLPTTDADYHKELFGSIGSLGGLYQAEGHITALYAQQPPLKIIDERASQATAGHRPARDALLQRRREVHPATRLGGPRLLQDRRRALAPGLVTLEHHESQLL